MRITRLIATVGTAAVVSAGVAVIARPASASVPPTVTDSALTWIERELNANGGALPASFDPSVTDWGLTIDAVLALNVGGRGAGTAATTATGALAANIDDYVTGASFGDPGGVYAGPVGKSLLAASVQGADVNAFGGQDLETLSRAAVQPSGAQAGRFSDQGSSFGDFSNGFGQALNILGLAYTDDGVPPVAVSFLLAQQCPAGGFRLTYDAAAGCSSDAQADTDVTTLSIQALLALPSDTATAAAAARAADWLVARQNATGGFGGTGPTASVNSNTTGLAAQVLHAMGRTSAVERARTYVANLQLDAADTVGTPAAGEEGAIAYDAAAFAAARTTGIEAVRDQWRRSTFQGVLAFGLPLFGPDPGFIGVTPARLLDTRGEPTVDGIGQGGGPVVPGTIVTVQVAGRGGVPTDASAAVLNVTADDAVGQGYVTVWACDRPQPFASNLNYQPDTPIPNAVITDLSATGTACLYTNGTDVQLIVDANGYFPPGSRYTGVTPSRLLDTRGEPTVDGIGQGGGPVVPGTIVTVQVAGRGGVPTDASAAVLNVTADDAVGQGYVTVWACDRPQPFASNLNYQPDTPIPNAVITDLSATGTACLYTNGTDVQLIVDANGYFPPGSRYTGVTPSRLLDTRGEPTVDGIGQGGGPVVPGTIVTVQVAGRGGVPTDASAAVLNVTADDAVGQGYVTVWACDRPQPFASNLNYQPDTPIPNAVITDLSATGTACLYTNGTDVQLIVDANGYFG